MRKGLFIVGVLSNKICDFLLANKVALGRVPNFCNKIYHNTAYFLVPGLWFKGHQIIRIMDIIRGVFLEEIRYVCGYWLINWVESHQNLHILGELVRGIKKNLFIIHQFRSSIRIDIQSVWYLPNIHTYTFLSKVPSKVWEKSDIPIQYRYVGK